MKSPLHLIMPMAGRGSRFSRDGFDIPKPLIEINGQPFFYWATRSIEKFIELSGITFVVLKEHVDGFFIDERIKEYFPDSRIIVLPDVTEGAAVTCLKGLEGLPNCTPVIFNDCDHIFRSASFNEFAGKIEHTSAARIEGGEAASFSGCGIPGGIDGALLTFESDSPAYSYLEYNHDGLVKRTVEKQVVSHDAICGAYYFKSRAIYENACADYLIDCEYKEYFVSGVYNAMIKAGGTVSGFKTDFHIPFGIPEEYALASADDNYKYFEELL